MNCARNQITWREVPTAAEVVQKENATLATRTDGLEGTNGYANRRRPPPNTPTLDRAHRILRPRPGDGDAPRLSGEGGCSPKGRGCSAHLLLRQTSLHPPGFFGRRQEEKTTSPMPGSEIRSLIRSHTDGHPQLASRAVHYIHGDQSAPAGHGWRVIDTRGHRR